MAVLEVVAYWCRVILFTSKSLTYVFSNINSTFHCLFQYLGNSILQNLYFVLKSIAGFDERIDVLHSMDKADELCVSIQLALYYLTITIRLSTRAVTISPTLYSDETTCQAKLAYGCTFQRTSGTRHMKLPEK